MANLQERWSTVTDKTLQSWLDAAEFAIQQSQDVANLQITTAKEFVGRSATFLKELSSATDAQQVIELSSRAAEEHRSQTFDYAQSVQQMLARAQSYFKSSGARFSDLSDELLAAVESSIQSTPVLGAVVGPVGLTLVKSTLGTARAVATGFGEISAQPAKEPASVQEEEDLGAPMARNGNGRARKRG